MKLFKRVVEVSEKSGEVNTVQLAREARRDYVLAYARIGKPESAKDEFAKKFGGPAGLKMLEQYGKLLFDTGRDPKRSSCTGSSWPSTAMRRPRCWIRRACWCWRSAAGKRRELLAEARQLVQAFDRVRGRTDAGAATPTSATRRPIGWGRRRSATWRSNPQRGAKTELEETWSAARALYANYLTLFPDAADAYDLRFFYGELLYSRGPERRSCRPVRRRFVRQDAKAEKPGRWLQKAAWSAVLLAQRSPACTARRAEGPGERSAQRPLTAEEKKLAGACRLYLEALPRGPMPSRWPFKVGRLEYVSGDYEAAQKHLSWIALAHTGA